MGFLSGNKNVLLVSQCNNLQGLTVTLTVTEDLVTVGNTGFGMQLNCFPQAGQTAQSETLNWFQYGFVIQNGKINWLLPEYWDTNNFNSSTSQPLPWPTGYTPNPAGTTTMLPVIANDGGDTSLVSAPSSQI